MTEEQVLEALTNERKNARRASIMLRLHQRYCAMRDSRERIMIMDEAIKP